MEKHDTTSDKVVESWIDRHRDRHLTLVMCGRIFGGRYGESPLKLERYVLETGRLLLFFDEKETLEVLCASSVEELPEAFPRIFYKRALPEDTALVVRQCSRLRFTWYSYGQPQTPENLCEEIYEYDSTSGDVTFEEYLSWEQGPRPRVSTLEDVDEMLRVIPDPDWRLLHAPKG